MGAGAATMGRPKKGAARPERAPDDRVAIIHLKGTAEYAEWLDDAFRKTHIAKATMFRLAMIDWAKKMKLPAPPEL
jgi:hypothetical protein